MLAAQSWRARPPGSASKRAAIFYKAAFYDRSANMYTVSRYSVHRDYAREDEGVVVAYVADGNKVIYTTEPIPSPEDRGEHSKLGEQVVHKAIEWLDKHYPDWKDDSTYWD